MSVTDSVPGRPTFCVGSARKQWIGLCWPVDAGGTHRPVQELYVLLQELAYARVPAEALLYSLAVSSSLLRFGSPELQRELLPVISRGDATFCEVSPSLMPDQIYWLFGPELD